MASLFDELEDETPPTVGQEIGTALSSAIEEVGKSNTAALAEVNKSNQAMTAMISKAINDALKAVDSKQITVEQSSVKKWIFLVKRDEDKLITQIIATAEGS